MVAKHRRKVEGRTFAQRRHHVVMPAGDPRKPQVADVRLNAHAVFGNSAVSKTNDMRKHYTAPDQKPGPLLSSSVLLKNLNN